MKVSSKGNETRFDSAAARIDLARKRGTTPGVYIRFMGLCLKCGKDKPLDGCKKLRGSVIVCKDCLSSNRAMDRGTR